MKYRLIAVRLRQITRRARQLIRPGMTDRAIIADLKRLPASHWRFYDTLEMMVEGNRSRLMNRTDLSRVIDCPLFTLNQKFDIVDNTSAYEPAQLDAIRDIVRDTPAILKKVVRYARTLAR